MSDLELRGAPGRVLGPEVPSEAQTALYAAPRCPSVELNWDWLVLDEQDQWILAYRQKSGRFQERSFCRTKEGLLRCIREYCGEVEPAALARIKALPDLHD